MNVNPIDFNYQDGLNRYPIQDYIDNAITNDITTNNIYMNDSSSLNDTIYYTSNLNLIIENKKILKGIYFKTSANYVNNSNFYGTFIDFTGKLNVFHNYNPLQPFFQEGYYDVEGELLALKNDGIATDAQLTALEAGAVYLQAQITTVVEAVNLVEGQLQTIIRNVYFSDGDFNRFKNLIEGAGFPQLNQTYGELMTTINTRANFGFNNAIYNGVAFSVATGVAGGLISYGSSYFYYQYASNAIYQNQNISSTQKRSIYESFSNLEYQTYSNYNNTLSNLNIINGFVNTNITTTQTIPKITTNEITYNGVEITTTLGNYLLKGGGTLSGRINFNYGGGNVSVPVAGGQGNGERINLNTNGITINDFPASIGVSANSLWLSAPNNHNFQWYVNGIEKMSLSSTGILNATTLQQGGQNITTISSNITLSQTPNLQKRYLIEFTCSTAILMPNGQTYYKRDIDLRNYTQTQTIPNPSSPFRVFSVKIWIKSGYFEYNVNGNFNVLQYNIYQSLQSQNGSPIGSAGENLHAIGFPPNPILNTITAGQICLVRTGNFNFLSVLSVVNNTVIQMIISDELF